MCKIKHPNDCEDCEDVSRLLGHDERFTLRRQNGSHEIWTCPDGSTLVNPRHRHTPKGTLCAIIKALAVFFPIVLLIIWYQVYFI